MAKNIVASRRTKPGYSKWWVFVLLTFVTITTTSCPGGEVSSLILGNKLNSAIEKINWGLQNAIVNGDYRLEKNLRSLQLMATNFQTELNKELARNREFASDEMSKAFDKLNLLVDDVQGGILEIEDFLYLDIHNLLNQIPFKKDIYSIRRINGYGTSFKESGSYSFSIIGNAFQPGKYYEVELGEGIKVDNGNIYVKSANQMTFELPVAKLNNLFTDFAITRTKLKIRCFERKNEKNPFFEFNGELLALPKFPVSYVFTEFVNRPLWSTEKYNKHFSFDLGPTGKEGKWDVGARSVSVDDPQTQRFTRLLSRGVSGSHCEFRGGSFTPDLKTYFFEIANQCHDCSRSFYGVLEYEKLAHASGTNKRHFESDTGSNGLLSYGTHNLTLSDGHQLFELLITFFNGEKVSLSTGQMVDNENGCRVVVSRAETGTLRRCSLEITKK